MASFTVLKSGRIRAQLCVKGDRTGASFDSMEEAQKWAELKEAALGKKSTGLLWKLPPRVLNALAGTEFTHADVVAGATSYDGASGVYFLIRDGEVVYVGKSVYVFDRIGKHRREGGAWFDSFNVLRCPIDQMDALEEKYILALMPKMNTALTYRKPQATPAGHQRGVGSQQQQKRRKQLHTAFHKQNERAQQAVDSVDVFQA